MREIKGTNGLCEYEVGDRSRRERKHPKLPAGFGSVRFLGKGRSNPYAVHPSTRGDNSSTRPPAICYVSDWHVGVAVLMAWNAGLYSPGLEQQIEAEAACVRTGRGEEELDVFCKRCLGYVKVMSGAKGDASEGKEPCESEKNREHATMGEIYEMFYERKFGRLAPKKMAKATADNTRRVAKKLEPMYGRAMDDITIDELQELVNHVGLGKTMVSKVVILTKQLYKFALSRELCTRNPAQYLVVPDAPDHIHHQDFSDEELAKLWRYKGEPVAAMILIMCYSGFRISEFHTLETDIEAGYFRGGIKTEAGKNRVVPIHSKILPLVKKTVEGGDGYLLGLKNGAFSMHMKKAMQDFGIDGDDRHHTPHSCRHTFSRLCESYGVREADRKRMLGHSFGGDITNDVYGHRTLEELRKEIEKITV